MQTIAPVFDRVRPYLAPVLMDTTAGARLVALVRMLPYSRAGCLEFRLSAAEPRVDFASMLPDPRVSLLPRWLETPAWQAVEALRRHRHRPDVVALSDYLEFDVVDEPAPIPRPRLYVAPAGSFPHNQTEPR